MSDNIESNGFSTSSDQDKEELNFSSSEKNQAKKTRRLSRFRQKKNIKDDLARVYSDANGKIPDLTKLEDAQRSVWRTVIYTLIVVMSVLLFLAIAGFWFFSNFNNENFTNENVIFRINPPLTVVSGQESVYTIMITNKEKVNLYNLRVEIFYPENFEFIEAEPTAAGERNNIWDFSSLRVGETQKIEIHGRIVAAINSAQSMKGTMTFKPANLNANFKQEAITEMIVSSSIINLNVIGPERALANQEIEYTIKYRNASEEEFNDLQLVLEPPLGFIMESAEPEHLKDQDRVWEIKNLAAGAEGEIKITGNYSALETGGNQEFRARIQIRKNGDYHPQSEGFAVTEVIKDQLSLRLIINGSAEDQPINFGDLMFYSIVYKNTGQEELKNLEISAQINSQIIDWGTLIDNQAGSRRQNIITWTGREIPQLFRLNPGEEGEIIWQVRVRDASVLNDKNINKFNVESRVAAKAEQAGELSGHSTTQSKTIVNSISSDLNLMAQARYYNEDNLPLGLGPIKPKVDEVSTYNIKLELANNLNDVNNLQLVITLPKNVSWAGKENHTVGDLIYNENSNKINWHISRLPKSAGRTEATFNVSIKPTFDDLGRVLVLVSEVALQAQDATTGAPINKNIKGITTAFNDPVLGQVNGIVE